MASFSNCDAMRDWKDRGLWVYNFFVLVLNGYGSQEQFMLKRKSSTSRVDVVNKIHISNELCEPYKTEKL